MTTRERVRTKTGVPVASDFASPLGTPIVIDETDSTGRAYFQDLGGNIREIGDRLTKYTSTVATGTSPYSCTSTTVNTNLNADLLDGQHGAYYLPSGSYTAADVLAKLLTVDGSGSGLDADLLKGLTGAAATYTPTLTNTTNIAASTAYTCFYLRLGSICVVAGKADIDPTAGGTSLLGISLPVASNFSSDEQAAGIAVLSGGASQENGAIYADATNDRVSLGFNAVTTTNSAWYFIFGYRVI